jgi:hypothetical protein
MAFKAFTVFYRSNTRIVDSNPVRAMDEHLHLSLLVISCVDWSLATFWSPFQGVLPDVDGRYSETQMKYETLAGIGLRHHTRRRQQQYKHNWKLKAVAICPSPYTGRYFLILLGIRFGMLSLNFIKVIFFLTHCLH